MREKLKKARNDARLTLSKQDSERLIYDLRQLSKAVTNVCCDVVGILKDYCDESLGQ